ncbi:hypothetical protein TUMEXPCC7403_24605 [Tumidithrix helvetica PCC 7403]|uniref:hypothetical protein n=1 Tax=Tumidithrix helvetica TaxID=3457545 RepID=UPI003CC40985
MRRITFERPRGARNSNLDLLQIQVKLVLAGSVNICVFKIPYPNIPQKAVGAKHSRINLLVFRFLCIWECFAQNLTAQGQAIKRVLHLLIEILVVI